MSQLSNITVFDGASTPVSHVLSGVAVHREKGLTTAVWREINGALPTEACISASMTLQVLKSGITRSELRVVVPTMEAVSGVNAQGYTASPKKAFEDTFALVGFHSPRSTSNGRRLARMLLVNMANNVSTSVAAATSGPLVELTDFLVLPS